MIGLSTINGYPRPMEERLRLYKDYGFGSLLLWWGEDEENTRAERAALAAKHGLAIENTHAQTERLTELWTEGDEGEATFRELLSEVTDCGLYGVPTLVIHLVNGNAEPEPSAAGLRRFEALLSAAERGGVRIALENVRKPKLTRYLLDTYKSPALGFCYDSGHEHVWTPEVDWLTLYADRLYAVHLHDNRGGDDSHMIPGDGELDWDDILDKIARSSYRGSMTVESEFEHGIYEQDGLDAFLTRLYTAGRELETRLAAKRQALLK